MIEDYINKDLIEKIVNNQISILYNDTIECCCLPFQYKEGKCIIINSKYSKEEIFNGLRKAIETF